MTGVLLVNMGGPESPAELKQFLRLMFLDKHIIPAPYIIRNLLSLYISSTRYKKSWIKYEKIGGTPLKNNTNLLAQTLQKELGISYVVKVAYSYSEPFLSEAFTAFRNEKITQVKIIPLYPQASITTTSSVIFDIEKLKQKYLTLEFSIVPEFYKNKKFINYWCDAIQNHISKHKLSNPLLVFSAHSIPVSFIKKGDTYQKGIEESARLIAENSGMAYRVSYQSGMNPKTWLGLNTIDLLESLSNEGYKEIVIIPISFVSENLETLYDLDQDIVPSCNQKLNINISRVLIPAVHPSFVEMLKEFITSP